MKNPQFLTNLAQTLRDWPHYGWVNPWRFEQNWSKIEDFSLIAFKDAIPKRGAQVCSGKYSPEISWKWCSAQSLAKFKIEIIAKQNWAHDSSLSAWNVWHRICVWIRIIKKDSVWTCIVLRTFDIAYFCRILSSSWQLMITCLKPNNYLNHLQRINQVCLLTML